MAQRPHAISARSGIAAAGFTVVAILLAAVGVATRIEPGATLGPGDWAAIEFTIIQALWSAGLSVLLAIPVARALARRRFLGRDILVTLLGAPFILPVVVAVMGLLSVFGRNGWVNQILELVGLPSMSIYGFHGVVLAHVFFNLPLATRMLLQGWQTLPAERFRLAAQLRLTPWAIFRTLEWPLLRQILPGVAALIFVICLTSFAVALTLGGGPKATTVELAIYQAFRFDFDLGRAAILSLVQLVMAGGAALAALWIIPAISLSSGQDRPVKWWDGQTTVQRLADLLAILLAASFLLLPLLAVLLRGVPGLVELPVTVWRAAAASLWVALLSVLILLILALPMAGWIAARPRGGVEAIGLLGLSTSPLMIGTGWFILISPYADPQQVSFLVTEALGEGGMPSFPGPSNELSRIILPN